MERLREDLQAYYGQYHGGDPAAYPAANRRVRQAIMTAMDEYAAAHPDCHPSLLKARLHEEMAARFPRQLYTVRFEQLVARPEPTLRDLHTFLEIPFDPVQLKGGSSSAAVPSWEIEWKARATSAIDPGRSGAWRHLATDGQRWAMHAIMGNALTRLGYPDAHLDDCPSPSRVRHEAMARLWRAALHPAVRPLAASAWRRFRTID